MSPHAAPVASLTVPDLARLFGASEDALRATCADRFAALDLRYAPLPVPERDRLILGILERIDSADLPSAGAARQPDWEQGWRENLDAFVASGYDLAALVPKYFKRHVPVRLFGDYVQPLAPDFVLNCTQLFRSWLFQTYLGEAASIYEFGCGPASHLAFLAGLYPGRKLFGFDWARPSQQIVRLLAERFGWPIQGGHFDFFAPDPRLRLEPGSAVFTFGALEQVGGRHEAFLEFLLRERPALCLNIECLAELYDPTHLPDHLALKYHRRRHYLDGYLTRLRELEGQGRVEILRVHHQPFGNLYDDSHSYVVWRPRSPV